MRLSYRQHLLEYFIYGIIWLFVFILPLTMIYFHDSRILIVGINVEEIKKEEFMKYISQKSIFL